MKKPYLKADSLKITDKAIDYYMNADILSVYNNTFGEAQLPDNPEYSLCGHCDSERAYLFFMIILGI